MNKVMKYLEEHKSATTSQLLTLDIDKPYLYQAIKSLFGDGYVTRRRMNISGNAYVYDFVKPFYIDLNAPKEIRLDVVQASINNMIRLNTSAY